MCLCVWVKSHWSYGCGGSGTGTETVAVAVAVAVAGAGAYRHACTPAGVNLDTQIKHLLAT